MPPFHPGHADTLYAGWWEARGGSRAPCRLGAEVGRHLRSRYDGEPPGRSARARGRASGGHHLQDWRFRLPGEPSPQVGRDPSRGLARRVPYRRRVETREQVKDRGKLRERASSCTHICVDPMDQGESGRPRRRPVSEHRRGGGGACTLHPQSRPPDGSQRCRPVCRRERRFGGPGAWVSSDVGEEPPRCCGAGDLPGAEPGGQSGSDRRTDQARQQAFCANRTDNSRHKWAARSGHLRSSTCSRSGPPQGSSSSCGSFNAMS